MAGRNPNNVTPLHPSQRMVGDEPAVEEFEKLSENEIKDICPAEFEPYEQNVWLEIASMVNQVGLLAEKNLLRIKCIVPIIVIFRRAVRQVGDEGLTWETGTKGRNGNQKKPHALIPTITAMNKEITSFVSAFGLDAVSELRLKNPDQKELFPENEW
ncbi:MAG: P27 family phage terminase small subunit [Alphaproteobacteria bacterium]|nr:P27 family phage terminase small subunit [Alphaproteobacteria bacterium]